MAAVRVIEIEDWRFQIEAAGKVYLMHLGRNGLVSRVAQRVAAPRYGSNWRELQRGGPAYKSAIALWEHNYGKAS